MHYNSLMKTSSAPEARPEPQPLPWSKGFPWMKILTFGANGRYLLAIAIILIRALQKNAEPMSQWSGLSWALMTMPIWLPVIIGSAVFMLFMALWVWANTRKY